MRTDPLPRRILLLIFTASFALATRAQDYVGAAQYYADQSQAQADAADSSAQTAQKLSDDLDTARDQAEASYSNFNQYVASLQLQYENFPSDATLIPLNAALAEQNENEQAVTQAPE